MTHDQQTMWKTESELHRLAQSSSTRYQPMEGGGWHCLPTEETLKPLGLPFRVQSSAELDPIYIDNLIFLEDYFGVSLSIPAQVHTYGPTRVGKCKMIEAVVRQINEVVQVPSIAILIRPLLPVPTPILMIKADPPDRSVFNRGYYYHMALTLLQEQLEWLKSLRSIIQIIHILVGTYDLLNFGQLNGQIGRQRLPVHFSRYLLQREADCHEAKAIQARWRTQPKRYAVSELEEAHYG